MEEYIRRRQEFEEQVSQLKYAGITFTESENAANQIFRDLIVQERAEKDDTFFKGFTLKHRETFEKNSRLYEAVSKLPKGAILHLHYDCCLDNDWFMRELAYDAHTYFNAESKAFKYFNTAEKASEEPGFKHLATLREESANKAEFDEFVRNHLFIQEEDRMNPTNNIWNSFGTKIVGLGGVLFFKDNFKRFFIQGMLNYIADGVLHVEARTFIKTLFHADGTPLTVAEEMGLFREIIATVQAQHPNFSLALIVQALKVWPLDHIEGYMRDAVQARKDHPDLIVGFDLVMEEDSFRSTFDTAPVLLKLKQFEQEIGAHLPLVLHGGESLNSITNGNLYDLLLLGTKRIGHGLNLSQHSYLLEKVKQEEICIEICPVSNQVLKYIDDIRLHPIKTFLNYGIKVCINPDDPSIFGYNGVSMDFFFTAIGTQLDYKDLKLCVFNSIKYSLIEESKKQALWKVTEAQLQEWTQWFLSTNPKSKTSN